MSVKEKAKAFEDRRSVVGESPPPRKKSREELIENRDAGDILGERHTTGPPVPPPRKYKKNGATRPNENSSPSTERKENMKPELNTTKPTSQSDSTTGRKPPRPPPPPRGSSLGRKSTLLSNAESSASGEKKIKPPVPPKPKNYVPKKVSSLNAVRLKSDNSSMSQPVKEKADLAPASSTASDKHKSQFFLALEKGNYTVAPSKGHDSSITSSNFFVPPEEKTSGLKSKEIESKEIESKQEVLSVSDNGINNVRNGMTDISMHENEVASQHGKTISPGKITSGKNMPDPLEGLEITVDEFSDEDSNLSPVVLEDEKENEAFADLVEVNGITGSLTEHGKQNVKILYSIQLEEECSVTRIDDSAERQELDDVSLNRTADVFEAEEINKSHISMGDKFAERHEETPDEKSPDEESYNSEPLIQDSSVEELKREGINDSNVNQKMEKIAEITLEKPTEDEEMCDLDILDDLSDDNDQNILEGNTSIEEFYKTTMDDDVEVKTDLQLGDLDSQQVEPMEESKKDMDAVMELPEDETQENSTVLLAEAIREGALISVTDHVVSEGSTEVVEEKGNEVLTNENPENLENELVKEELEITASFSENEQVVENTDSEHSVENFRNDTEGEFPSDVAMTFSEDVESENVIVSELNEEEEEEEEKSDENVVEDSVPEDPGKEEDTVHITETFCSSGNGEQVEEDSEGQASIAEPTVETSKEVVECIVNAVAVSTEDEAKVDNVVAPSVNEPASEEDENAEEAHSPTSPQPVRPERRSRQARQQKNVYENVDTTIKHPLELIKSGTAVRKTQSFSKYETVVLSLPRPIQRVSDDEAIYRVPRVIPVESHANDDSVYSVPCQVSSRRTVQDNDYAVPKPIVVQACAVRDTSKSNEGDVYSVPGQVTAVPVVETFAEPSSDELVRSVSKEGDDMYAVPVQEQLKSVSVVPVPIEETQEKTVTVFPVPAEDVQQRKGTPPPKPPRWSLTKDEMKINLDLANIPSSASAETTARESPKPVPRTREQRNSPSPVPRKSSKTAESSDSATPPKSESPIPAPRSRLNALQSSTSSNVSSSEHSMLSSSEVSTQESTEEESTIKRRPPRPPPPNVRVSLLSSDSMPPPESPGPFEHDLDSDSDSDVGEESPTKGPSKPKTFYIAHEILTTERTFVDALKLVFEECYGTIKNANVIADAVLGDIFRDLENIYLLDSKFLQELEERMETWEEHERIGDIIKKYGHFLKMYTQYVNGYDKAMSVFQDTMKENLEFANLVSQFQASERCHGMILSAYMLKPVQRIPSYRLLLIDYLKHLPKDSEESKDTEITLKIVSEVATHINESMKKMDSFEQMLKLQRMLVGQPEIVKAGRDYLKEGTLMKLCRKDMQERMFFLLTDVLLYTTPVGGNQYKLNKTLPLLGMQVLVPDSPDFVNEFSIISTTRSFTLTASTPEERDQWVEAINDAIDVVTKRKITFVSKTRDAAALGIQEQEGDFKLGEKAPVWIPDARVTMCMSCTSPFTLTNRRHHCRACGNVVCGSCSESTAPLVYLDYTQARVCDKCYDLLLKDFHTDEIHVEEEAAVLPPLLQEVENAEKLLRKPTKFEIMRRFKSRKTKRKSQIMHPAHLTEVVANQEGSQMSGYLRFKKGRHGMKKAWFVLKNNVLYSYKASSDVVALETLPVLSYEIEDLGKEGDDFVFQLKHRGVPPLVFKADNETSGTRWLQELKKAITMET